MRFYTAFEKAFGRPPTPEELAKVQRVKDAFGVDDNDALMAIAGLLVFYDSGVLGHLQQGARMFQAVLRAEHDRSSRVQPPGDASRSWRVALTVGSMWTASIALVAGLALTLGSSMNRGHPCWVPKTVTDSITVAVLGAPTGWLVLLSSLVPGLFAGAWAWTRGMDERREGRDRWLGWAACTVIGVVLLSLLAIVLVKVPRI